jgi:Predicted membrane protein (DUF2069)
LKVIGRFIDGYDAIDEPTNFCCAGHAQRPSHFHRLDANRGGGQPAGAHRFMLGLGAVVGSHRQQNLGVEGPAFGHLKNRMYTYRWVSLFIWFYATEGSIRAASDRGPSVPLAIAEVVLCLILFTACSLHVRWRFKLAKQAAA